MAGNLTSITDPAGNVISYACNDRRGLPWAVADPDAGVRYYAYDLAGNQTIEYDADPATADLHTIYDALHRPTQRRSGSVTGTLLAEWRYDATGEKGLLDKTIRYDAALGSVTVDVIGYDNRQRPTGRTWIIPPPPRPGPWPAPTRTATRTTPPTTRPPSPTRPRVGSARRPSRPRSRTTTGAAQTLVGAQSYVSASVYDNSGRVDTRTLGTGTTSVTRDYTYDADRRLSGWKATTGAGAVVQDDRLLFDDNGNVTERHDARATVNQRECFGYDQRNRLTRAYTTTAATCGTPNASGPTPYDHTYTYAVDGKLTSRIQSGVTSTYTYPAQGTSSVRPARGRERRLGQLAHDPNGQLTSRPGSGAQQTLASGCRAPDDFGRGRYCHDDLQLRPRRQRILRQDAASTVLYIEGHEFTRTGTTVKGKRYYTIDGVTVAVRDATTGQVSYLLGDQLGSTSMTVNATTGTVATEEIPALRVRPLIERNPGDRTRLDRPTQGHQYRASIPQRPLLRPQHRTLHSSGSDRRSPADDLARSLRLRGREPCNEVRSDRAAAP